MGINMSGIKLHLFASLIRCSFGRELYVQYIRLNTLSLLVRSVLTKVQHQLQVVLGGQRLRALQSYGEGLTPADNQALPVNLPGAVSRVVVTASQIHISNET